MTARDALTKQELVGESIYELMRRGALSKEEFCTRMDRLERDGPAGQVGAAYGAWLLLRTMPPSAEKMYHMGLLSTRLRTVLRSQVI